MGHAGQEAGSGRARCRPRAGRPPAPRPPLPSAPRRRPRAQPRPPAAPRSSSRWSRSWRCACLGLARVALSAKVAEASIDQLQLERSIKAESRVADRLELDKSLLVTPSRIESIAAATSTMTKAAAGALPRRCPRPPRPAAAARGRPATRAAAGPPRRRRTRVAGMLSRGARRHREGGAHAARRRRRPRRVAGRWRRRHRRAGKEARSAEQRPAYRPRPLLGLLRRCSRSPSLALAGRLVWIQGVEARRVREEGGRAAYPRHGRSRRSAASIYDREGEPLAISVDARTVYAVPSAVKDATATATTLAGRARRGAATTTRRSCTRKSSLRLHRPQGRAGAREAARGPGHPGHRLPRGLASARTRAGELACQVARLRRRRRQGPRRAREAVRRRCCGGKPGSVLAERDPYGRPIPGGVDAHRWTGRRHATSC